MEKATAQWIGMTTSCQCHKNDIGCAGAIEFRFPVTMFLPSGALEHRIHRSKFLSQMAEMYDEYANSARAELMRIDPQTVRPELEKLPLAVIDVAAMVKAQIPWEKLEGEEDATERGEVESNDQPEHQN